MGKRTPKNARHEGPPRPRVPPRTGRPVGMDQMRGHVLKALRLLQRVQRDGVGHDLDDSCRGAGRHNTIMLQPETRPVARQTRCSESIITSGNDLQSTHLLPQIIIGLHDTAHEVPGLLVADGRLPPDPCPLDGPRLAEARLFHFILACILLHRVLFTNWRGLRRILQAIKSFRFETKCLLPPQRPDDISSRRIPRGHGRRRRLVQRRRKVRLAYFWGIYSTR